MVKDREAWHAAVHRIAESDRIGQLNNNREQYVDLANVMEYNFLAFLYEILHEILANIDTNPFF